MSSTDEARLPVAHPSDRPSAPELPELRPGDGLDGRGTRERPTVLYFTASWCGPCATYGPVLQEFAAQAADEVEVVKVDVDVVTGLSQELGLPGMPSLVMVVGGEPVWICGGAMNAEEVRQAMEDLRAGLGRLPEPLVFTPRPPVTTPGAAAPDDDAPALDVQAPELDSVLVATTVDRLAPGERTSVAPGTLLVQISAPEGVVDTAALDGFAPEAIGTVVLEGEVVDDSLGALSRFSRMTTLMIASSRPLSEATVGQITSVTGLRDLLVQVPGLDLDRVRQSLPATVVNLVWIAPELGRELAA